MTYSVTYTLPGLGTMHGIVTADTKEIAEEFAAIVYKGATILSVAPAHPAIADPAGYARAERKARARIGGDYKAH